MAQLKYTLVKNWSSGPWIINGATVNLLDGTGGYYDMDNQVGLPLYNTNTMPRSALIKVSLDPTTASAATGYSDEVTYPGETGYYSICSADLCVANTGNRYQGTELVTSVPNLTYANFGVNTSTGAFDPGIGWQGTTDDRWFNFNDTWNEITGQYGDGWGTGSGMSPYNPLRWTEYDAINGVQNYRVFNLLPNGGNNPWNVSLSTLGNTPPQQQLESVAGLNCFYRKINSPNTAINGSSLYNNGKGSQYFKKIMMVDTVGKTGSGVEWKGLQGNEVLIFITFKDDAEELFTNSQVDSITWGLEILGRPQFTHTYSEIVTGTGTGTGTGVGDEDDPDGSTVDNENDLTSADTNDETTSTGGSTTSGNSSGGSFSGGGSASIGGQGFGMPGPGGATSSQFRKQKNTIKRSSFLMEFDYDDEVDIKFKASRGWGVKRMKKTHQQVIDGGLDTFEVKGRSFSGKWSKAGTLRLSAPDSKYFTSQPYLKSKNTNIKLKYKNKKLSSKSSEVIYYCFDIMYKSNTSSNKSEQVNTLIYNVEGIAARNYEIYKVDYGNNTIRPSGETRNITVYGYPGTNFSIAINEVLPTTEDYTNFTVNRFSSQREVSILKLPNHKSEHIFGRDMFVLKAAIGVDGKYTFKQNFPSNIIRKTKTTNSGTVSTHTIDIEDKNRKLKINDRFNMPAIPRTDVVKVSTVVSGLRVNLDRTVNNIAAYSPVHVTRDRFYTVHLIQEGDHAILDSANSYNRLRQSDVKKITFDHQIDSRATITSNNGVNTSASPGEDFKLIFSALPKAQNVLSDSTNKGGSDYGSGKLKKVSLLITLADTADRITAVKTPILNTRKNDLSDWTNSIAQENSGTNVSVVKFSHSALNTGHTITLTWYYKIVNVGLNDVTMAIDLNNILTIQDN